MIVARHMIVIAFLLAASSAVKGQVEVAPPPHLTLDEVVKEYLRLKIPLPPKDAELVVVREPWTHALESGVSREFAFRSGRAAVPAEQRFFNVGRPYYLGDYWQDRFRSLEVDSVPVTLEQVERHAPSGLNAISLAVIMRLRGREAMARIFYAKALEGLEGSVESNLREFRIWLGQWDLMERRGDRAAIYRELLPLGETEDEKEYLTYPYSLERLKKTLVPNTAKPGSVEWLINDLVNYWEDEDDPFNEQSLGSYFKLIETGLDAVPALIDHFDDDRYTKAGFSHRRTGVGTPWFAPLPVGSLCRYMVEDLSGLKNPDAAEARKWLAEAKKLGEKQWLFGGHNTHAIRIIGAKYPKELSKYLSVIQTLPWKPRVPVPEVLASNLTKAVKITLFEEYLSTDTEGALEGLVRLHSSAFHDALAKRLKDEPLGYFRGEPMVLWVTDRTLSQTAFAAWHKAGAEARLRGVRMAGSLPLSKQTADLLRATRLQFLLSFTNDHEASVRDLAIAQLGGLLGFQVQRNSDLEAVAQEQGLFARLAFRAAVQQAASLELERLRRP